MSDPSILSPTEKEKTSKLGVLFVIILFLLVSIILGIGPLSKLVLNNEWVYYLLILFFIFLVRKISKGVSNLTDFFIDITTWVYFFIIILFVEPKTIVGFGKSLYNFLFGFSLTDLVYLIYVAGFLLIIYGVLLLFGSVLDVLRVFDVDFLKNFIKEVSAKDSAKELEKLTEDFHKDIDGMILEIERDLKKLNRDLERINKVDNNLLNTIFSSLGDLSAHLKLIEIKDEGGRIDIYIVDKNGKRVHLSSIGK